MARLRLTAVLLLPLLLAACIPALGDLRKTGPLEISIAQESVRLAWDHSPSRIPRGDAEVSYFRLYFREHGRRGALLVSQIRADGEPEFTLWANRLIEPGETRKIDLGVSSVTSGGVESAIHWSTDFEAWPHGGWYIRWTRQ